MATKPAQKTSKATLVPAQPVAAPTPAAAPAAKEPPKMDTATDTAAAPANGTTKRGPGRPPAGTPRQTPEERLAKDKARRAELAAMNARDKLLRRVQYASEHCAAILDDVKRCKLSGPVELAGLIGDSFVAIYKEISEQPDDFALERRAPGTRGPRKVPTFAEGSFVTFREKYADKWSKRFDVSEAHKVLGQDDDYVMLSTRAGFTLAVPAAHVQAAPAQA